MTNDIDLSIREIDDLLQHLYLKLRGKKEGLSMAEPAALLLARLRSDNPSFYAPLLARFTPIIMDTLVSEAFISFGYEGLKSLLAIAGDIYVATGDYIPTGIEEGLSRIREEIGAIDSILGGGVPGTGPATDAGGASETGTGGFFRESAWGTAGLPLVSTYNTGKTPFSTGRVIKARIEVRITGELSVRNRHEPVITFEHISAEPNSTFEMQIRTAVRAAERHVSASMGIKDILRVPREYHISLPEIASFPASAIQRLSGGSAGLAVEALLVSVLSSLDLCRQRLSFGTGTAFTGKASEEGEILDVEDSQISEKIRAVFFSRYSTLVLPAGNLGTAEKELASLSREYPARRLRLVPVADIVSLLGDSGVTSSQKTPAGKPLLQRLFMWRKHLIASLTPAVLAVLILFILPPYLDRKVNVVDVEHDLLVMKNKYGHRISTHDPGFHVVPVNALFRFCFHDLDGRPGDEVLAIASESRQARYRKTIFNRLHFLVFSGSGHLLHDRAYDQEEIMGEEMDALARNKSISMVNSDPVFLDELGKGTVVVGTSHQTFMPAALVKADLNTGEFETFFHKGFFSEMLVRDLDGDGRRDILLTGFNVSMDAPVVVVIDPANMQGSSPPGYRYSVPGMEADVAKYYVKFPEFRLALRYNTGASPLVPALADGGDTLAVVVKSHADDVKYSFVKGMRVVGAEVVLSHHMGRNRPDSLSTEEYPHKTQDEKELLEGVRYWNGSDWVSDPVMNMSYIEQAGIATDSTITTLASDQDKIIMTNRLGKTIAAFDAGFTIPKQGVYRRVFFGDFLEEKGDEIVLVSFNSRKLNREDPERNRLFIMVFNSEGGLLRRYTYDEISILGTECERASRRIATQMQPLQNPFSEELGKGYIYILTHHKAEPPASLIRFSLNDGSYQTFFHKGILRDMSIMDIDGDGRPELLLLGYNTVLDAPVVIALDPENIQGSSPDGACYELHGAGIDIAKYYARLPFYSRYVRYNFQPYPLHINFVENTGDLRIIVQSREEEVIFTIAEGLTFTEAKVVKKDFVTGVITPVDYHGVEADELELLRGIRFWDGESWVAVPSVNRSYLAYARGGG